MFSTGFRIGAWAFFGLAAIVSTCDAADAVREAAAEPILVMRVLASPARHEHLIALAREQQQAEDAAEKPRSALVRSATNEADVARWYPLTDNARNSFENNPYCVVREVKSLVDQSARREALLVLSPVDVTSEDVEHAALRVDDTTGKPLVDVQFTPSGTKKMRLLTGNHLPSPEGQFIHIGIVVAGKVESAPRIQSEIGERAVITGNFTEREVRDLVALLNIDAAQKP